MFHANAVFIVLLLINNILLQCCPTTDAYTQVAVDGSSSGNDGPKIYKAVNFDLIFPKSFNSSENVISTTPETIIGSPPKTAVTGQAFYPLSQSNVRPPYNHQAEVAEEIPAAIIDKGKQQPTLYITPPPPIAHEVETDTDTQAAAATNEAAVIYERHQNTNGNNYNYNNGPQVVTPNPINIQQQQLQQQREQYEEQQQQLNVNNKAKTIVQGQQQEENLATGRAVDYQSGYPFGQLITPLIKNTPQPVYRKPVATYTSYPLTRKTAAPSSASASGSNVRKIIYPQAMYQRKSPSQAEIDKLRGKGYFRDRFSPSEGVASINFKNKHDHSHNHDHSHHHNHAPVPSGSVSGKTASASNTINSFAASTNLYSFPPNNINYPKPNQDNKISLSSGQVNSYSAPASGTPLKENLYNKGKVNSYSPPASGPLKISNYNLITADSNSSPYQYNGPVSISYLPPVGEASDGGADDSTKGGGGDGGGDGDIASDNGDDTVGVLPASVLDQVNDGKGGGGIDMSGDMSSDDMSGGNVAGSMNGDEGKANSDHSYDTGKEYATPPPGWLEEHPESAHSPHDHDHDHHHDDHHDIIYDHDHFHHDIYPSFPSFPIYPSYPHLIYDDHDHHHLPDVEPPAPMQTTTNEPPPPPEPKPEPRVKKYSYFYIGRKLWYIPLYFTIWFSFYVLWLILKSIARHKVQLPNHYTGDLPNRYVNRRSLDSYDFSKIKQETLNDLTVSVLDKIDKFKRKYLNGN